MPIEPAVFAAFVLSSVLLLIIPGPTVIMVIGQAIAHGRPVALASVLGVGLGDLVATSLSLAGVGALLAASATAFTVLKFAGAAYLVWLGIKLWRAPDEETALTQLPNTQSRGRIFRDAFLVTLFNPKGIVFFVAFVPQFIDHSTPYAPQAALLVITFTLLAMINSTLVALTTARARDLLARPKFIGRIRRTGGACIVGAGLLSLAARRPI